jgi:NADH-quinone oxidoreductase subunit L
LAIAGVPPFSGFWSKDEVLLYAFDASPALWAVGLVTALLTAFYMSRQVFLVFFGEERFRAETHAGHPTGDPHESPWVMTVPLVALAVLSAAGGALNLPFTKDLQFLDRWLHPVVDEFSRHHTQSGLTMVVLGAAAAVMALVGIAAAARVYLQRAVDPVEPEVLANAWYYDSTLARLVDGPGRAAFEATATFDRQVVDGAVNGVAAAVRRAGGGLRRVQSGLLRSYALGVTAGAVGLLVYFTSRIAF